MTVEIREYKPNEMKGFIATHLNVPEDEADIIQSMSIWSDPILAFFWDNDFLALVGFIPTTIIPSKAYCWMQDGPDLRTHPYITAKIILGMRGVMLRRYPIICGHCKPGSGGVRWLTKLGAVFGIGNDDLIPFELRTH